MKFIREYFQTAVERYEILQRKRRGESKPWTQDSVYQDWRFCNVHREDDKTTVWFRQNVRRHLQGMDAIKATVAFRWFNRIETGERILDDLLAPETWDRDHVAAKLQGVRPVVTGAYIIKGMDGMEKLDGVLECIGRAFQKLDYDFFNHTVRGRFATDEQGRLLNVTTHGDDGLKFASLYNAWRYFKTFEYLGGFMAYEIVSDLRWTYVLSEAPDITTWANAGPGCARGLSRVAYGEIGHFNPGSPKDQTAMNEMMQEIVQVYARDPNYWPQSWPSWEMREAEHWSCEFDKYMRIAEGGRMKQRYGGR